jgi:PIN domain nuclease of toxin-antitoxin system
VKLLLDSHVFIWWDGGGRTLGAAVRDAIEDPANQVFVSAASVWEIAIKRRVNKIRFDGSLAEAVKANGFVELPITAADAEAAGDFDWSHSDPFDRLLAAQTRRLSLTLVTADAALQALPGLSVLRSN